MKKAGNKNAQKRAERKKDCKACDNARTISVWQFTVDERGYVPAKKAADGGYENGRLLKVACHSCTPFGASPQVLYKGVGWRDLPEDELASPEKLLNLKELESIPVME